MLPVDAASLEVLMFSYDHVWCVVGILQMHIPAL